ncbi:MAG TPA: type II toxin-antitoxin system HipA family toxin [Polyangia bacterium]|jgi:serine/threonine-protein kinase HipA
MSGRLGVYFEQRTVGAVSADDADRFSFEYEAEWLADDRSFAISQSLPLVDGTQTGEPAHAFFTNLLPEGRVRTLIARRLGISEDNDFGLLAALGGECAGALVLAATPPGVAEDRYRQLDEVELGEMATSGAAFAELVGGSAARLSLAGAQDKLPVKVDGDRLLLPLGASPSSHILKFASRDYKHLPGNELLIGALARASGLPVVAAELRSIGKDDHLLVRRYDRVVAGDRITRLHQEDLCQAFGLPPGRKYEEEGGPSFDRCFRMIADCSTEPALDTRAVIRWLAFNAIVGNADGHAKNLSLVRAATGALRLAPFYDLLSTAIYPKISRRLAMVVGENSDPGTIRGRDWRLLAERIEVNPAFVVDTVRDLAEAMPTRAAAVAKDLRERHGRFPVAQAILRQLRKSVRRTLDQLKL